MQVPGHACVQADFTSEPTVAEDGKIWTPGAVDFFRIVNEQVAVPSQGFLRFMVSMASVHI